MKFLKDDHPIRIAVVDDDPLDIELLDAYLSSIKEVQYRLYPFHQWASAENVLHGMDLLILDFYLGSDDALTILRKLRKTGNEIPIIVLTGNQDTQTAALIIQQGADDYLTKGEVNADQLYRSICNVMERWHLRQEQKKLQVKMQTLQRMEAMGAMAGGIAHDFNNILSPIMGYAEMLLMDAKGNETLSHGLNEILSAARRAKSLVHQILTFSRQNDVSIAPMQMHLVINEAIKLMKATLPATIKITAHIEKEYDRIMGDPTQIHQVMMNLMTNAYHAMEKAGGELSITLSCETLPKMVVAGKPVLQGRYVHLTVTDTGEGIPPELIDRVFDPYITTKQEGKGTGLGLAVVHGIVKSFHGFISIQSEVKKGTSVHVHLPFLECDGITADAIMTPLDQSFHQGSGRILFVDDEISIIRMGKKMVKRMGYQVTAINDSIDALNLFKATPHNFDLVITDYTMPEMTGTQLAEAMMAIRPDIPVILCTGFNEQITEQVLEKMGIRHLLMKPFDQKELSLIIHDIIGEKIDR